MVTPHTNSVATLTNKAITVNIYVFICQLRYVTTYVGRVR